ncbi:MAG: sensor histidine kinase [Saprospiraceae bacterium]
MKNSNSSTFFDISWKTIGLHVLTWVIVIALLLSLSYDIEDSLSDSIQQVLVAIASLLVPVYLHFGLWGVTIPKRRFFVYGIGLLAIIIGWSCLLHYGFADRFPSTSGSLSQAISNSAFCIIVATGIRAVYRLFRRDREVRELQLKQNGSELDALRAQVNPHFLFNTLNNIYAVNLEDSEKGSEMLLELAEVMRYHFDLSRHSKISLEKEIELIRAVVKLESLRLRQNTKVELNLDLPTIYKNVQIAPLLLVPFVENAFKHGAHPSKESFIQISLNITDGELEFSTKNSLHPGRKTVSTGVGLPNVMARLKLLYPNRHTLSVGEVNESWEANIQLQLNETR